MTSGEPYPGTQAVLRALSLLKAFTDERPEWNLADLARAVGLNKTTTYRLLTALESEGLVARSQEGDAYRLGPEMIVLGGRAMRSNTLLSAGRPELELLAKQTRETVTIEVLADGKVLTLDEIPGNYLVGSTPEVGSAWPAHATSTGKLLLAYLPPAELKTFLKAPLLQLTPYTVTAVETLRQELAQIREQEFAVGHQELEIGFVSIAIPIRNHTGQAVAALSVGGSSARWNEAKIEEITPLVQAAAGRISARLGFRPKK
jgi:IclR family transcriptional regulator, acetate operon repressor